MDKIKNNKFSDLIFSLTRSFKNWQAFTVITLIGFISYFDGLRNAFLGDDLQQIVNNTPVHSISNIKIFFEGGTFYNYAESGHRLIGPYYRPLMTTTFSVIYSIFGADPFWFHLFQLLIGIASAILLYLFFCYSFSRRLSLLMSLIFLVHPIDSQAIFAIASMQDALFLFFGILALYLILRFRSLTSLGFVVLCLFLSLLSKETGVLFVFMAGVLLYFWNKHRFKAFLYIMILPLILWFGMRVHAVHLFANANAAPLDNAGLKIRLLTMPSIIQFYLTKLILPFKIASGYYWEYKFFSVSHVLIPLIIDLLVLGLAIYAGYLIKKKASNTNFRTYCFYGLWFIVGLFSLSQLIPTDLTANTLWFYFPMIGLLGMIGILINSKAININWLKRPLTGGITLILGLLIGLTIYQGQFWKNDMVRDNHDVSVSKGNYNADQVECINLVKAGRYAKAKQYAIDSTTIYPDFINNYCLGLVDGYTGNYTQALTAFNKARRYPDSSSITPEDLYSSASYTMLAINNNYLTYRQFILQALSKYSDSYGLWLDLALLDQKNGDNKDAQQELIQANKYGQVSQVDYECIIDNKPFLIKVGPKLIRI